MVSTEQRRHALLYVAGRFMMVHIEKCARARATRHKAQARKLASQQATLKLGPGRKLTSMRGPKPASAQVMYRGPRTKYRGTSTVGLD